MTKLFVSESYWNLYTMNLKRQKMFNYKYKSDKEKFGFLEVRDVPELQEDGFYYGDC